MNNVGKSSNFKQWLLVGFGTLLGLFFLYLAFRGVSWAEFRSGLAEMRPVYLLPSAVLLLAVQLVRALRFGLIVSPFSPLNLKDSWDLMNIWGALNLIIPARLGELARPYLLQRRGASFSSVFGAVLVERFFDLLGLLLLLGVVLWTTPQQIPWVYVRLGQALLLALAGGYAVVLLVLIRREQVQAVVDRLVSWLPSRAGAFLGGVFQRIVAGLGIMASWKQAVVIFIYSVTIWTLFSTITYLFLRAFSIDAPFLVAVTTQVLLCIGVALPSAPGFIGTFHAACRYALALFGITAAIAVPFATVYHLFNVVLSLSLGMISYWTGAFRVNRETLYDDIPREIPLADTPGAGKGAG